MLCLEEEEEVGVDGVTGRASTERLLCDGEGLDEREGVCRGVGPDASLGGVLRPRAAVLAFFPVAFLRGVTG